MSTKGSKTTTRRRSLAGLAGLGALASPAIAATNTLKRVSLLSRKAGISHEEFVKHWVEIHAPLAYACPGISRYTVTIVTSSSTRKDVPAMDAAVDGIAEMWFKDQAALDAFQASPATRRLRDDGATFIGKEIDFTAVEKVIIPR